MLCYSPVAAMAIFGKTSPPPAPATPATGLSLSPEALLAIGLCWVLPAVLMFVTRSEKSPAAQSTLDGTGKEVPKDVIRRQEALAAKEATTLMDRVLQIGTWGGLIAPLVWVFATQENPTAKEQVSYWVSVSWAQLTNGQLTPNFQIAAALLFIERATYTWVHTFSASFIRFANSPVGRLLGKKPLDVVLNLFFLNKTVQMGTFIGWYFYIIDFESPFEHGYKWSETTRLQWALLGQVRRAAPTFALAGFCAPQISPERRRLARAAPPPALSDIHTAPQAIVVGQGLNTAIYRTIGKAGVYYGYRLGVDVPWVVGFPFNVGIPHPQYIGACLTCFGVNAWCATEAHLTNGWLNLTMIQVLYYVYMGLVEDYL